MYIVLHSTSCCVFRTSTLYVYSITSILGLCHDMLVLCYGCLIPYIAPFLSFGCLDQAFFPYSGKLEIAWSFYVVLSFGCFFTFKAFMALYTLKR